MAKKLTQRQEMFAVEYCKDLNQTRAAIAVGCPAKSAASQGSKWVRIPKVKARIDQILAKVTKKAELSAEMVLEGIRKLAFFDIRKLYNPDGTLKAISELDDETASAICGMDVEEVFERFGGGQAKANGNLLKKIKLADRGINLERLGRVFKMFTDKVEVTGLDSLADAISKARKRVAQ